MSRQAKDEKPWPPSRSGKGNDINNKPRASARTPERVPFFCPQQLGGMLAGCMLYAERYNRVLLLLGKKGLSMTRTTELSMCVFVVLNVSGMFR